MKTMAVTLSSIFSRPELSKFEIELCHKSFSLVDHHFEQYWFDHRTLYGTRKNVARNLKAMLEYFHQAVLDDGSDEARMHGMETYLLTALCPHIRSHGAQKIFPDAVPRWHKDSDILQRLNDAIRSDRSRIISDYDFYVKSRESGELPDFSSVEVALYEEMLIQLFANLTEKWVDDPVQAIDIALTRWMRWQTSIGRRSGNEARKKILDVLSHECKAAFNQCYSALWAELAYRLPALQDDKIAQRFHQFWHCEYRRQDVDGNHMHLVHGFVFSLHPAFALLIQTEEGRKAIESHLTAKDPFSQGRFFSAAEIAFSFYMSQRDEDRHRRKP